MNKTELSVMQAKSFIESLLEDYDEVIRTREWESYTNAKSVAMNLHVEAGELAQHFTWLLERDLDQLSPAKIAAIEEEIGDVMLNVLHLSKIYNIDALKAARDKLEKIKAAYPIVGDEAFRKAYMREE